MEVEALIEAVRKRQVLYNKSDEDYSNRVLVNQLWNEIAQEVGIDGATARKKWAVLRDSFRRHHKKETKYKSGSGGKQHKTWYLYKSMSFLLPFAEDLNSMRTSNLVGRLEADEESQQSSQVLEDSVDTVLSDIDTASQAAVDSQRDPRPDPQPGPSNSAVTNKTKHNSRKRPCPSYPQNRASTSTSTSPFDAAMLDALILKSLQQQQQEQQRQTQDDDEHFLMSLLPVMKSLDPITKFEFRGELNNTALRYLRQAAASIPVHKF